MSATTAAPASGAPGAEGALGQLEEAITWLEGFPSWLDRTVDDVIARINGLLSAVPGFLSDLLDGITTQARALLDRIRELAGQLLTWLQENVWPVINGPFTLWEVGNEWTTSVYQKVTDVSGQIDANKVKVDDYWQGPAANAYLQAVSVQKAAADKVAAAVSAIREAVQGLAFTLGALYTALVAGLLAATIEIMGGSAAVATFLGIPPGLMAIIAGLVTALGTVAGVYAVGKELVSGTADKFAKLLERRNDGSAFDHGHWPKAAADLGDASMTDGDRSDWSYKR